LSEDCSGSCTCWLTPLDTSNAAPPCITNTCYQECEKTQPASGESRVRRVSADSDLLACRRVLRPHARQSAVPLPRSINRATPVVCELLRKRHASRRARQLFPTRVRRAGPRAPGSSESLCSLRPGYPVRVGVARRTVGGDG
jgi:hypothetical protein